MALGRKAVRLPLFRVKREKFDVLSRCAVALSKPGTITLQLALLGVPTVVTYKTSFFTYYIARSLVNVPYMGLPNLFLQKEVFPEAYPA